MFRRSMRVRREGFHRYDTEPEGICKQIIQDCWSDQNGYFMVSNGHFREFYMRDFAFCAEALRALGYHEKVTRTLHYALTRYQDADKITTAISPDGQPFDFPDWTPESLAWLLYTLVQTDNKALADEKREFLQKHIRRVAWDCIDQEKLIPRPDRRYQSLRDQVRAKASCYTAVMLAVIARDSRKLGLDFPYRWQDLRDALLREYWNGTYFFSDITKQDIVIGHANVFPFWTGIVEDKEILEQAMTSIMAAQLDEPFPLRYVNPLDKKREKKNIHFASLFSKDYMTDSIWTHLGLCYIQVLQSMDMGRAAMFLERYTDNVRTFRTFLELYGTNGDPYQTAFYMTDEAMLWCAPYLWMAKKHKIV